jgi:hypothetical protein
MATIEDVLVKAQFSGRGALKRLPMGSTMQGMVKTVGFCC